jgi:hypothetical protein
MQEVAVSTVRLAWLPVVIILLDQGIKLLSQYSGLGQTPSLEMGPLSAELNPTPLLSQASILLNLSNSTTLVMMAGILGLFLLIGRWSQHLHFITAKTSIGLQLAAGALTSHAIDMVLRGASQSTLRLEFFHSFTFNAGIADLALISGLFLLLYVLLQGKTKLKSHVTLLPPKLASINFSRIPRGIDNIHIDVLLSPEFRKRCTLLAHRLVPLIIKQFREGKTQLVLPKSFFTEAQKDFNALFSLALRKGKESGEKQLPDLLYIAILKHVHNEVNNLVATTIKHTKESIQDHHKRGVGGPRDSGYVEWLFRHRDTFIARSNLALLRGLIGDNLEALAKTLSSFLGIKHTFALQVMQSPLTLAEAPNNEQLQMDHYLLLGQQQNDPNSFIRLDRVLTDALAEYLPLVKSQDEENSRQGSLAEAKDVNSNIIDSLSQPSVLMHPYNITILLDTGWTTQKLKKARSRKKRKQYKYHLNFQRRLQDQLISILQREGLVNWVNAAYAVKSLLRKGNADITAAALTNLLARSNSKQELTQRLQELFRVNTNPPPREQLIATWEQLQQQPEKQLRRNLQRFLDDFAAYRRDLLLLLTYQRAATELTLLSEEKDIQTSRANYTLYEFLLRSEITSADTPILSHIIIKADLRGSTEVTEKLTELKLNPATHFDRNFFTPINEVIESYGAEKVFIEGDAIILALNEYGGEGQDRMIASRACGLAARILQIVAKQNRELAAYGLPQLELGIGVAYCDHAPRYLFDGQHRITISPAINRADRLSACTHAVRRWRETQQLPADYVEVYQPSASAAGQGEKAQKDMVFNLNGVLLEPGAFTKLEEELTLYPLRNRLPGIADSRLYAITFPDLSGESHSLVIRKAPVREYDPDSRAAEAPAVDGRFFYEVIYRRELLEKLKKK